MRFPKLPYMTGKKRIRHENPVTMAFRGLNLTNATQDGEFSDTLGLSTTDFPYLTQIVKRTMQTGYTTPTDAYVWDGHLYVVDGTSLKKDKTAIAGATLTSGQKQMAVINTKLVIYPDKIYIDMTDNSVHSLVNKSETYATYTITTNSIQATGIATAFADGDVVDVTGTGIEGKRIVVQEVDTDTDTITFVDGAITLGTYSGNLSVKTSTPDLDFICSSNNRIWGVCNADNTVYASALGDPTTFFDYTGESGSYSLAIGSDGDFTGICNYGGAVCVWKENILHKILGSYPSEYYMVDYPVYGVQKGSEKSLVVINNVLYYKGIFGVYQYGGNTPQNISVNLGNTIYKDAVAGTDGRKYYINMKDAAGNFHLYAYDLLRGFWMKEEDGEMPAITNIDQDLYFIKKTVVSNSDVYTLYKTGTGVDLALEWTGEFVETTEDMFYRKGYLKLLVRLDMALESSIKIYAKEDRRAYRLIWENARISRSYFMPEQEFTTGPNNTVEGFVQLDLEEGNRVYATLNGETVEARWMHRSPDSAYVITAVYPNQNIRFNFSGSPQFAEPSAAVTFRNATTNEALGEGSYTLSIWKVDSDNDMVTMLVPIRLGRCDRWQLKFEGTGEVVIRAIGREHVEGSVK